MLACLHSSIHLHPGRQRRGPEQRGAVGVHRRRRLGMPPARLLRGSCEALRMQAESCAQPKRRLCPCMQVIITTNDPSHVDIALSLGISEVLPDWPQMITPG